MQILQILKYFWSQALQIKRYPTFTFFDMMK